MHARNQTAVPTQCVAAALLGTWSFTTLMYHHPSPGSPLDAPWYCNLGLLTALGLTGYGVTTHQGLDAKNQVPWYCVVGGLGFVGVVAMGFSSMCNPNK